MVAKVDFCVVTLSATDFFVAASHEEKEFVIQHSKVFQEPHTSPPANEAVKPWTQVVNCLLTSEDEQSFSSSSFVLPCGVSGVDPLPAQLAVQLLRPALIIEKVDFCMATLSATDFFVAASHEEKAFVMQHSKVFQEAHTSPPANEPVKPCKHTDNCAVTSEVEQPFWTSVLVALSIATASTIKAAMR